MIHDNYHQHGALPNVMTGLSTTKAGIVSRWRSNCLLGVTIEKSSINFWKLYTASEWCLVHWFMSLMVCSHQTLSEFFMQHDYIQSQCKDVNRRRKLRDILHHELKKFKLHNKFAWHCVVKAYQRDSPDVTDILTLNFCSHQWAPRALWYRLIFIQISF